MLLSLSFDALDSAGIGQPTLAERIERGLGIEPAERRIILGPMEILLAADGRLETLEMRTNPSLWRPGPLLPVPADAAPAAIDFMVDYDENGIASHDLAIAIAYDAARRELSLRFGDFAASRWRMVADGMAVGTTLDDYLGEFRLSGPGLPAQLTG